MTRSGAFMPRKTRARSRNRSRMRCRLSPGCARGICCIRVGGNGTRPGGRGSLESYAAGGGSDGTFEFSLVAGVQQLAVGLLGFGVGRMRALQINAHPLPRPRKIAGLGEDLPETAGAARGLGLMLDVQAALVLHMGQDVERVQRLYSGWRRAH